MSTKSNYVSIISRDRSVYSKILQLMEEDKRESLELLAAQRNPDEKTFIQGQVAKLKEYIKILT